MARLAKDKSARGLYTHSHTDTDFNGLMAILVFFFWLCFFFCSNVTLESDFLLYYIGVCVRPTLLTLLTAITHESSISHQSLSPLFPPQSQSQHPASSFTAKCKSCPALDWTVLLYSGSPLPLFFSRPVQHPL